MKKSNLSLSLIFLVIVSFFIWVAFRNEKRVEIYTPDKNVEIPMIPEELEHTPIDAKG